MTHFKKRADLEDRNYRGPSGCVLSVYPQFDAVRDCGRQSDDFTGAYNTVGRRSVDTPD
jgi:hypothetical protein